MGFKTLKKIFLTTFFLSGLLGFFAPAQAVDDVWCYVIPADTCIKVPQSDCLAIVGKISYVLEADCRKRETPKTPPTDSTADGATGGDSTGDAETPKKKMTPEEEEKYVAAYKAAVESEVTAGFNKIGTTDPKQYVGRIITGLMGVLGSITLVMFVYSGFLWMTAAGDAGKAEKARDILVWSSLGLVVIFSSYALVRFVLDIFPQG